MMVGPAATIYVPIHRKFVLSAYGSPQYVWYSKTERERTWNYYLNGAAQLSLKNVFFSLEGVYSDARERWNTILNAGEILEIATRREEEKIYVQIAGVVKEDAYRILQLTSTRSNIPEISKYAFCSLDPRFADRALEKGGGFIAGGDRLLPAGGIAYPNR
jgi:hypothetical protein